MLVLNLIYFVNVVCYFTYRSSAFFHIFKEYREKKEKSFPVPKDDVAEALLQWLDKSEEARISWQDDIGLMEGQNGKPALKWIKIRAGSRLNSRYMGP